MTSRNFKPPSKSRNGGFTLLELLLAFVVFALSFATVLEILSGSMRNTVRARHYTEAALTAQSVMNQVGLEIPLQASSYAEGESAGYEWTLEIFNYADSGENPDSVMLAETTGMELLQIELEVSWGEPPRRQTSRFSTVKAMMINRDLQE